MRLEGRLPRLLVAAAACAFVGWPVTAGAAVEEVIEEAFDDGPAVAPAGAPAAAPAWSARHRGLLPAAGHPHAAATSWRVDWTLAARPNADGCAPTRVRTLLRVRVTLPSAATALRPQIDRLRLHEAGHLQLARLAAGRVDAELSALPPMADCGSLHAEAARRATAQIDRLRQDQTGYDALTEHGRGQGARSDAAFR